MGRIITRPDGRTFHLGGRLVPKRAHHIRLHDPKFGLNLSQWPTPDSTSFGAAPAAQPVLTDILGNDQLGDCTEANSYHLQALRQAAGDGPVYHPTLDQVIATYSRDGGYVVGQPDTDQGCDETTVLGNAQNIGISCGPAATDLDTIAGYMVVDPTNRALVRAVVSTFVGAAICMGLPDSWVNPFPSGPGWTWDANGSTQFDPNNGHCFTLGDQTDDALGCWSWGMPFTLTYDALAAGAVSGSGGALYVLVDRQILNAASLKAPDALDWAAVMALFNTLPSDVMTPPGP